jgi:hypothetical protein
MGHITKVESYNKRGVILNQEGSYYINRGHIIEDILHRYEDILQSEGSYYITRGHIT